MVAVALVGACAIGVTAWAIHRLLTRRSYVFRLGRQGLWIDGQFYHWRQLRAVTYYADLHTLLIKVHRPDEIPLALQVDLSATPLRQLNSDQLQAEFARRVDRLTWKSV